MHQDGGLHVGRDALVTRLVGDRHGLPGDVGKNVEHTPLEGPPCHGLPVDLKALDHGVGSLERQGGSERNRNDELRPENDLADTGQIIDHSIGDNQLRTDYLADIRVSEAHADAFQQASERFSLDSEAWAKGTRASAPVTEGTDGYRDNSKYYKGRSEAWATGQIEGLDVPSSDVTYENNSKFYVGRAEAWAVGRVQNQPVLPGDATYENNSKYYSDLSASIRDATEQIRSQAADLLQGVTDRLTGLHIMINYSDGRLYYDINSGIRLVIDPTSGNLLYEVVV